MGAGFWQYTEEFGSVWAHSLGVSRVELFYAAAGYQCQKPVPMAPHYPGRGAVPLLVMILRPMTQVRWTDGQVVVLEAPWVVPVLSSEGEPRTREDRASVTRKTSPKVSAASFIILRAFHVCAYHSIFPS